VPAATVHVSVYDEQQDLPIAATAVKRLVRLVLSWAEVRTDEVDVHLYSAPAMATLHQALFDDPSDTDCITLPIDSLESIAEDGKHTLGECFVCPVVAMRYVTEQGGDVEQELARYLVHCLLHLMGYEDKTKEGQAMMRAKEDEALAYLRTQRVRLIKTPRSLP